MGKLTTKKSKSTQRNNQSKNKRKGRPPKKKKYVQQIDSSDEDSLSVSRSRVIPIRKNEIPMRPEIHIPPSIPSFNNLNNIQQSSSDTLQNGLVNEQQPSSATTSSRITITMTSVTTNSADISNTTTYVTTEILPMNEITDSPQLDSSENRPRTMEPSVSMADPANSSSNSLNDLYSNGSYPSNVGTKALNSVTQTPAKAASFTKNSSQTTSDVSGYSQNALNGIDSNYQEASNISNSTMASLSYSQADSRCSNSVITQGSQESATSTDIHTPHRNNTQYSISAANAQNSDDMWSSGDSTNSNQLSTGDNEAIATRPRYYRIPDIDTLDTVYDVWNEWNVGIGGNPSIISLMETYGNKWQLNNRVNLAARKKIIKVVQLRAVDIGLDEALDEMEKMMGSNRLSWLAGNLRKKK